MAEMSCRSCSFSFLPAKSGVNKAGMDRMQEVEMQWDACLSD